MACKASNNLLLTECEGRTYILLDVLLCSIAEYFYELCKQRVKILSDTTQQNV